MHTPLLVESRVACLIAADAKMECCLHSLNTSVCSQCFCKYQWSAIVLGSALQAAAMYAL